MELVQAQRLYVQLTGSRRQLEPWQRPWNILSDLRDTIVIRDGVIEQANTARTPSVTASPSHWVRPLRPWILRASA